MPRTSASSTPKYRKHRASGQAVVTLNGRDIYLGPYGTAASRREYDRILAEWLASGRHLAKHSDLANVTIVEVLNHYLRHCMEYYAGSPNEIDRIKHALRPVKSLYGHSLAKDFGPLSLEAVRRSMIEGGLSLRTINQRVDRIKRMFRWAVRTELVSPSIWHGLQTVTGLRRGQAGVRAPKSIKPVSDEFVDAVIPHVLPPIAAMIKLQRLTGMRPGEVTIMRPRDLDTTGKLWVYTPAQHKTLYKGHERRVYLGPQAQEVLAPFLCRALDEYLFSPADAMRFRYQTLRANRKSKVQPSQISRAKSRTKRKPGNRYTVASYRRAIERGCRQAFPPPPNLTREQLVEWVAAHSWHPHQLRHNAATRLRKEHGIEVARLVLGHRSAAVTEIYAEVDFTKAAEIMGRVG